MSLISDPFHEFILIAPNEKNPDLLRYIAVNGIGNFIAWDTVYGQETIINTCQNFIKFLFENLVELFILIKLINLSLTRSESSIAIRYTREGGFCKHFPASESICRVEKNKLKFQKCL